MISGKSLTAFACLVTLLMIAQKRQMMVLVFLDNGTDDVSDVQQSAATKKRSLSLAEGAPKKQSSIQQWNSLAP
jgi:hypothetical protein